MRQRINTPMSFPYDAQIAAKCSGLKLWKDGIRFIRPTLFAS